MQSENVVDLRAALSHRAEPAPREIGPDDWQRYEQYMEEIFAALGMAVDTPGTRETPARFLRALHDATAGYDGDPKLLTAFPAEGRGGPDSLVSQVVEGPISFHCLCEHHALPFFGEAHVAYVPRNEIIGISKLTRLVQLYARRFTVQERLGEQIADSFGGSDRPARRRRPPRGCASLHADARCAGGELAHRDDVLARRLYRRPGAAAGLPRAHPPLVNPLELLWEADGLPSFDLPEELERLYGGGFGLARPLLFANFVETLDGVVAIRSEPRTNRLVSGDSEADRFVMGLLRACADSVLLGSGTLHGSPTSVWTPERACPAGADAFSELRQRLGLEADPELAVLTASGAIEPEHPALERGAVVLTTKDGAARCRPKLPGAVEVVVLGGESSVDPAEAVGVLNERGRRSILSEAGPHVFGSLLAAGLVDELFLTVSPLLAGRSPLGERLGLVEGEELLPGRASPSRLLGVRRDGAHLFLRYGLSSGA